MPYVLSKSTAEWIKREKAKNGSLDRGRRGWIFDPDQETRLCLVMGGSAATGYDAQAFYTMEDLKNNQHAATCKIYPTEISLGAEIPPDTIILCHYTNVVAAAVEDEEDDSSSAAEGE